MCLVFFLLALYLHGSGEGYGRSFIGASLVLVLALFSKETAVMFPAAAFLADYFFRDRQKLRTTLRRWPRYLTYAILAALYAGLWMILHSQHGEKYWHVVTRWGGSFFGTVLTMSRGFVYYLRLVFFPVDMAQDWYLRPISSPDPLTVVCLLAVVGLLLWSVGRGLRRGGFAAFAVLWAFVTMFPTSNLAGAIGITTAERFLLLPMVGVSLVVGPFLLRVWRSAAAGRALVVALVLSLTAVTVERSFVWTSVEALWETTLARSDGPRALDWKAKWLRVEGERLLAWEQVLRDEDRLAEAESVAEEARQRLVESIEYYDREIALWSPLPDPEGPQAIARAGRALSLYGLRRYAEMLEEGRWIVDVWYDLHKGHYVLALAHFGLGHYRRARLEIERALALRNRAH